MLINDPFRWDGWWGTAWWRSPFLVLSIEVPSKARDFELGNLTDKDLYNHNFYQITNMTIFTLSIFKNVALTWPAPLKLDQLVAYNELECRLPNCQVGQTAAINGLEAGNLIVELPRLFSDGAFKPQTGAELLSHHKVASHVRISVVQKNANVGVQNLFDERSHVAVLLLVWSRNLVRADVPFWQIFWDMQCFADILFVHVRNNVCVIQTRDWSSISMWRGNVLDL